MLSRMQETQHQKHAAVPPVPGRQPRGPVPLAHGPGFLRHEPLRPVHGTGLQRQALLRMAPGSEFSRLDPEFHPLDLQRLRQERRCAM